MSDKHVTTGAKLAQEIAAVVGSDPIVRKEFLTGFLSLLNAPIPSELLDRQNIRSFASTVVTERDIHQARLVVPEDARHYACRDSTRPRSDNAWLGADPGDYEAIIGSDLYKEAMKVMENTPVGGLVTRKHDRPRISDGKKIGTLKVPAETVDAITIARMDDGGVHPRDAILLSTNAGRVFTWDPLCPEDEDVAESKPIKGGRLSVIGGVPYTEGFTGEHVYDTEKKEFVAVPNNNEQSMVRMGVAPANPIGNFNDPPQPYMFRDR